MRILPTQQTAFLTITFFLAMSSVALGSTEQRYTSTFDQESAQQVADAVNAGNDPGFVSGTARVVQGELWRQSETGENLYVWYVYAVPADMSQPGDDDPTSCSGPDCE